MLVIEFVKQSHIRVAGLDAVSFGKRCWTQFLN